MSIPTERHGDLLESLKQFLTAQSIAPERTVYCPKCGAVLSFLPMQFWFEGGEKVWSIPLPYCQDCHPLPVANETFAA